MAERGAGDGLAAVREQIAAMFEAHRQAPGAPWSEDRFLRFLLRDPATQLDRSWSFARRRARFFEAIEARYLIAMPGDAFERAWDFEPFCRWVLDRAAKPAINRRLAEQRARRDGGCLVQLFLAAGALALAARYWRDLPLPVVAVVAALLFGLAWFTHGSWRRHRKIIHGS